MAENVQIAAPAARLVPPAGDNSAGEELRVLSRQECVRLLGCHQLGRLAWAVGRQAKIFPINYLFDGTSIVVRTGPGFMFSEAPMRDVAFEIDAAADDGAWGWSVVVEGTCLNITGALDGVSERAQKLPVHAWAPGVRAKWLRIDARHISGRGFGDVPHDQ
ncbi:MAG: pyridoxamine 5'-phosphate oxidase family protein [Acidimicrobiales bacterium]